MKTQTIEEMISDFKMNSASRDAEVLEEFFIDYAKTTPQSAYENLEGANPNQKVKMFAQEFIESSFKKVLNEQYDYVKALPVGHTTYQAEVVEEFCRNLYKTEDFSRAWEHAQNMISADQSTSADLSFRKFMRDEAERFKPIEKKVTDYSQQEDESSFIKIRSGLPERITLKHTKQDLKAMVSESLTAFYRMKNLGKNTTPNVGHEAQIIHEFQEVTLALRLARQDTAEATTRLVEELQDLTATRKNEKSNLMQGIHPSQRESVVKGLKYRDILETVGMTGTEKMEIVRNLIIDLKDHSVADAFSKAIKAVPDDDVSLKTLLTEYQPKIEQTIKLEAERLPTQAKMLLDGYTLYLTVDSKSKDADVLLEASSLATGKKSEIVHAAVHELKEKTEAYIAAANLNSGWNKVIHSKKKERAKHDRENAILDIGRKNDLQLSLENAMAKVDNQTQAGKAPNLEAGLN